MAVKPISLPNRNLPNLQASAAGGRAFRMPRITPSKLFPRTKPEEVQEDTPQEQEHEFEFSKGYGVKRPPDLQSGYYGGMNQNDMKAFLEDKYYEGVESGEIQEGATDWDWKAALNEYNQQYKIPEGELGGLRREAGNRLPGGDMDISQGIPEGVSDLSGFAPLDSLNEMGLSIQEGDIKGAVSHGIKGVTGIATLPAQIPMAIAKPVTDLAKKGVVKGWNAIKGAFGGPGDPGGTIGSGPGVGMPADMGLPAPGALGPDTSQSKGMPDIVGGPLEGFGLAEIGVNPDIGFGGGPGGGSGGNAMGGEAPDSGPY